uniref:UBR-type domain-containing protein n=1 Tax=Mesocestoides corti TaxID=53468 RepID=A0A5K3EWM4_MESCO
MQRALTRIINNHHLKLPPDDEEINAFRSDLEGLESLTGFKIPSEIEGCLALLCSRQIMKDDNSANLSSRKPNITWLLQATLFEISRSTIDASSDAFYGLRVLLTEEAVPAVLLDAEYEQLRQKFEEKDTDSSTATTTRTSQSEPIKKKLKKAPIAAELWEDVSSTMFHGDRISSVSLSPSSIARSVFWKERGSEVILTSLQTILKGLQNSKPATLGPAAEKAALLCQILKGAVFEPGSPTYNFSSLPPLFVNNWIKSVFKVLVAITRELAPTLFARKTSTPENAPTSMKGVFEKTVFLLEAFSKLFSTPDKRRIDCFEYDAAYLWFSLRVISAYCLSEDPGLDAEAPLVLHPIIPSEATFFTRFTNLALDNLNAGLRNSSAIFKRPPWSEEASNVQEVEDSLELKASSSPSEWSQSLYALDAYERFVLEPDFRQSLVMSGPLDIFLLDVAYAFYVASV